MKYLANIKTLLLSVALLAAGAFMASCDDDDDDIIPADALFRPIVGETTVGGQWIELEWDRYEGAERYVLTLEGQAVGEPEPLVLEAETDTTFYRFEGLAYDTDYTIRIKSIGNGLESKFYTVPTITTQDYPTMLNGVSAIDNKALVSWKNANYTTLNLVEVITPEGETVSQEVEVVNYTLTDADRAAGQVIFNDLIPDHNYIVRAYENGAYAGKKVFKTAEVEQFEGAVISLRGLPNEETYSVLTSDFYADAIAQYPDQDLTIVLEGGHKYEMMSLKLPATTGTIKLVTGLSLAGNAIMEVAGNYDVNGNLGGFVAEKVNFTEHANTPKGADNFGGSYLFNLSVSGVTVNKMEYINCDIRYKRGVVRIKTGAVIEDFVMDNCTVDSIGGYGITNADNGEAQVYNISLKNSSFSHCQKLFVSTKNSAKEMGSFSAENCTFVYNLKAGGNYLFDFNKMVFDEAPVLKNCLFGMGGKCDNKNKAGAICGYRGGNPAAITVDNCFGTSEIEWYIAEGATAPAAPLELTSTGADTDGTFEDADNANFKLLVDDLKGVAGDPRWW